MCRWKKTRGEQTISTASIREVVAMTTKRPFLGAEDDSGPCCTIAHVSQKEGEDGGAQCLEFHPTETKRRRPDVSE